MKFAGDAAHVRTRWLVDPAATLGAESANVLIGSNFLTNWGSVGFFGPLTIRPDFWDKGVASRLLEPTMDIFAQWRTKLMGLYTFAQSAKHVLIKASRFHPGAGFQRRRSRKGKAA